MKKVSALSFFLLLGGTIAIVCLSSFSVEKKNNNSKAGMLLMFKDLSNFPNADTKDADEYAGVCVIRMDNRSFY